jgi:hypothetical protein
MAADAPKPDPSKLLGQLKSLIESKSVSTDRAHNGQVQKGKSWIWSLIIPMLVLAGLAAFAWFAAKKNRELAKLRHEKNKAKILKEQAVVQAKIATNDTFIAEQKKIFNASQERIRIISADIDAEEKRYEADMRSIDSIRSWRDAGLR